MATYKDADAIFKEISRRANLASFGETTIPYLDWKEVLCIIDDAPAADVVEVVRCKDCKYAKPMSFKGYFMCKRHHKYCRKADDFCSYGERREQ